jgi:hypothetical protein
MVSLADTCTICNTGTIVLALSQFVFERLPEHPDWASMLFSSSTHAVHLNFSVVLPQMPGVRKDK